jgi:hypothetical protein
MSQSQKRPRTDTKSHIPPPPRKARVDEDPGFTLFDEGDCNVADMDQSLFDGQLSELTDSDLSDWGSESGLGLDEEITPLIGPSGNWEGVRKAQDGYKLPGVDENLEGPDVGGLDIRTVKLGDAEREVMSKFTDYLVKNWPGRQLNPQLVASSNLALADPTAFWSGLFEPKFTSFIDSLNNAPAGNRSARVLDSSIILI